MKMIFDSERERKFLSDLMRVEPFRKIYREVEESVGPQLPYEFANLAIPLLREWVFDHREVLFAWLSDPSRKTLTRRDKLIRDFEETLKDARVLLVDVLRLGPIIRKADRRADLLSHIFKEFPSDPTSADAYRWSVRLGKILMVDPSLSEEDRKTVQDVFATQLKYLFRFREKRLDLEHITFHRGVRNELFSREIYRGIDPLELEGLSMRVDYVSWKIERAGSLLATKGGLFDDRIYRWDREKGHVQHYLNAAFARALKGERFRFTHKTPPPGSFLQIQETTPDDSDSPDRFTGSSIIDSDRPALCASCLESPYCSSLCPEAEISICQKEDECEQKTFVKAFQSWMKKAFNLNERIIFNLMAEGLTVDQIMRKLGKTQGSVKGTQKRIKGKIEKFLKSYSIEMIR